MKIESLFLLLSLGVSVAFASYTSEPTDDAQSNPAAQLQPNRVDLEKRVSGRWDALIAKDFTKAYEYFSPAYRRLFPLDLFLGLTGSNVQWSSIDIKDVSVAGNRAEVRLLLHYRVSFPPESGFDTENIGAIEKFIDEVWLWKEGNWWYVNPTGGWL